MPKLDLTKKEISVIHDVLVTLTAYTEQEMRDQLGWTRREMNAWETAIGKTDTPPRG